MNNPVIGFIGQGFIGKNYADDFQKRGFKVIRYALEEEYIHNKNLIQTCDIVFIAVPTPTTKNGCDVSLIETSLPLIGKGKIAVIKSTMIPGTTKRIQEKFSDIFVLHSPEFLREVTAAQDAANPERNIIGIPMKTVGHTVAAERVLATLPQAPFSKICLSDEAEFIKYAGNNFLHMKVVYINILYDLAKKYNCDWSVISESMVADTRIGSSHMNPVHDGGRGAGGHCFIKDFAAFRFLYEEELKEERTSLAVLRALEEKNVELLRDSKKNEDLLDQIYGKENFLKRLSKKVLKKITEDNLFFIILIALGVLSIIFNVNDIYNVQTDTAVYVNQIKYFGGDSTLQESVSLHSFKPLYGILGAALSSLLTPYQAILSINIFLYISFLIFTYLFLLELRFKKDLALLGSIWVATAYPVLKYGLALLTDISGWFFAVATSYIFLVAIKKDSKRLIILASCFGFLGSLCKETGVLGLLFGGLFLTFTYIYTKNKKYILYGFLLSAPFLLLQTILRTVTKGNDGKTFLDWFLFNTHVPGVEKFHSLYYFVPVEAATFNVLWLYAGIGLFAIIKNSIYKNTNHLILGAALCIATLPALLWPFFYIRILFIQILILLPLSLFGVSYLLEKTNNTFYRTLLILIPIITSLLLFFIANGKSLFDVFHL